MGKTLRISRIVVQGAVMLPLTALLLATPAGVVLAWRGALTGWMIMPLAIGSSLCVVAFWAAVTLIFGRLYCSTMCPIGTLQDVAARLRRLSGRRRGIPPYRYEAASPWYVRGAMVAILIVSAGLGVAATQWALMPFIQVSPVDSYELILDSATPAVHHLGWRLAVAAGVNLVFIVAMGMFRGRVLCNNLCPLGGALGTLNSMALMQIDINTDKCTHCRRCEDACKAVCINSEAGTVDSSRCVTCFDCLAACHDDAIHYTTRRHRLSIPMLQKIDSPRPAMGDSAVNSNPANNISNPQNKDH